MRGGEGGEDRPARSRTLLASAPALVGRTGRGVRVAVIDSGVNVPHPHLPRVAGAVAFDLEGHASDEAVDVLGHGTAVAAAIHEKAPAAELLAIKVFDRVLATSVPTLVRAIDHAAAWGARLVNLSLGTPNPFRRDALLAAVERAAARGTLVVSARGSGEEAWYPGALPGVLGVEALEACPRDGVRIAEGGAGAGLLQASPYPRPIPGVPPERNLSGISFAVANATGLLALALEGRAEETTAHGALAVLLRAAESARDPAPDATPPGSS